MTHPSTEKRTPVASRRKTAGQQLVELVAKSRQLVGSDALAGSSRGANGGAGSVAVAAGHLACSWSLGVD